MENLNDPKVAKCVLFSIIIITMIPIVTIVKLITSSYILGIISYFILIYIILRYVGRFALYPGSTGYITQQLQQKMSVQILKASAHIFGHLHHILEKLHNKQSFMLENQMGIIFDRHTKGMAQILQMFQDSLSDRKKKILQLYRRIRFEMHYQIRQNAYQQQLRNNSPEKLNFIYLANFPQYLSQLSQNQHENLINRCRNIKIIATQLLQILQKYKCRNDSICSIDGFKHFFINEKLYEIRFGYYNWKSQYKYDFEKVRMSDGAYIQTVIIHRQKSYQQSLDSPQRKYLKQIHNKRQQQDVDKPVILFCNPNGVFVQFFALDNSYIRNYLRMGFKVILWNYRGYGQSQSTPTLSQSQKDAIEIYEHYAFRKNYKIPVVHGYSIGGIAAVSVGLKYHQQVKMLIADRTFSSIQSMSKNFGTIVNALTKIVFYKENFSLAKQFIKCQNEIKIVICDENDQVISEESSLKKAILDCLKTSYKQKKRDSQRNIKSLLKDLKKMQGSQTLSTYLVNASDQQIQLRDAQEVKKQQKYQDNLVERSQTLDKQRQTRASKTSQSSESNFSLSKLNYNVGIDNGTAQIFLLSVQQLLNEVYGREEDKGTDRVIDQIGQVEQKSIHQGLTQKDKNEKKQSKKSQQGYAQMRGRLAQKIIQILSSIDGGGVTIFNKNKLHYLLSHTNKSKVKDIFKSYLLGLAHYGSFKPLFDHRFQYDHYKIKKQTLQKLNKAIESLIKIYQSAKNHGNIQFQQQRQFNFQKLPFRQIEALKSLIVVYKIVQNILFNTYQNQEMVKRLGILIPTSNGHNCDLNQIQFMILKFFLSKVTNNKIQQKNMRHDTDMQKQNEEQYYQD